MSDIEEVRQAYLDSADLVLQHIGEAYEIPNKPGSEEPALPENLDTLDDSALVALYVKLEAWLEYASTNFVVTKAQAVHWNEIRSVTRKSVVRGAEGTKEERDLAADLDPDYVRANTNCIFFKEMQDAHEIKMKAFSRRIQAVSRTITIRTAAANTAYRGGSIQMPRVPGRKP